MVTNAQFTRFQMCNIRHPQFAASAFVVSIRAPR